MKDGLLTQYIEAGLPHLRQVAGLPEGLMPDFVALIRQLGDEEMLKLAEPRGLMSRVKEPLAQAPDPDSLPAEIWQQGTADWQPVHHVLPVTMALLHACERINALARRGALKIDSALVRGLAVIAYAPFVPNGGGLLSKLADILSGTAVEPARLLDNYLMAVITGDTDTLAGVDHCIMESPAWWGWSERFLAAGKDFPFLPKVIGISPPLTEGLKQVLTNMMREALNAEHNRNYPN